MRTYDWKRPIRTILVVAAPACLALGLYAYLLSQLPSTLDKAQVLTFTHRPDLLRIPEILGAVILVAFLLGARRKKVRLNDPCAIFAMSFAILPFLLFNQQLISGRSIQPFHYEVLIANYVVLVGLIMVAGLLQPAIPRRATMLIIVSCLLWGTVLKKRALLTQATAVKLWSKKLFPRN